ncbi:hypothetical protein LPJ61_000929 [Coemansia biformis]|uniref:Uncharacterized protein n=1 Tax=Coemansia biformis TaxID=1286918 RepID=A0A9W7YFD1_9FUNG|nr:hypothetical protein LPJ61_000929 [Coemansia biformis]
MCRSPSQSPGAAADAGSSGASSLVHSRSASVSMTLAAGKKGGTAIRPRRPSEGGDSVPASDAAAAMQLLRASSTDERPQSTAGAPGAAPGPGDTSTARNSEPENEADDGNDGGDGSGGDADADAAERVFEDFTYKNLALLSHVNRGMSSSSGSASPMPERPPLRASAMAGDPDPGSAAAPRDA